MKNIYKYFAFLLNKQFLRLQALRWKINQIETT